MEQRLRNFKIDYCLNWNDSVSISKIREDLDAIEKLGATHINFDVHANFHDDLFLDIEPLSHRLETIEEQTLRLQQEKNEEEIRKTQELKLFESLKSKYNLIAYGPK